MSSEIAISVRNVGKQYLLYEQPIDRLKQMLWRGRKQYYKEFTALEGVSFDVPRNRTIGIIGHNGSGKSTLLQILCGTVQPSSGEITVNGRVSALLELGAGFNPEFNGRENVILHGAIMGFTREQMEAKLPAIESFAEIGQFILQPVKTYSSGMFVRLAFAAAIHVEPDILVIDEALAVGDAAFQHKCMARMREFMNNGTVLFVSHDMSSITSLCSEVIWLDHGRVKEIGDPRTVSEHYLAKMFEGIHQDRRPPAIVSKPAGSAAQDGVVDLFNLQGQTLDSFGTGDGEITGTQVQDLNQSPLAEARGGEAIRIVVSARAKVSLPHPIIGFALKDVKGNVIFETNTDFDGASLGPMSEGEVVSVAFAFTLPELLAGSYSVSPALANGDQRSHSMAHWVHNAAILHVSSPRPVMGVLRPKIEVVTNQQG